MSMTDSATEPAPATKKKRGGRRGRGGRRASTLPRKPPSELAGLTQKNCPTACGAERCVISGRGICGHPFKGGLQGMDMHNPDAVSRLSAAKKLIGKKQIDMG